MRSLLAAILIIGSPLHALSHIGVGSGYAFGRLRAPDSHYRVVPFFVHLGWSLNRCFDWQRMPGDLQIAVEGSCNSIINPRGGAELAAVVSLLYRHQICGKWQGYIEAGTGPAYLSIDTRNQGHDGFNFLNQGGGGVYWSVLDDYAVQAGYRYRHMSHGNTRESANSGIDSHSFIVGLSRFF